MWHDQHFECFANRVERNRFAEVDSATIGALSVDFRAQTAREIIEDRDGSLRKLLRQCELWVSSFGNDLADPHLSGDWTRKDKPLYKLWDELVR